MKKYIWGMALVVMALGCGGGGGGGGGGSSWDGPLTPGGYPDIAGTYSLSTSSSTASCPGADLTVPIDPIQFPGVVTQNESFLRVEDPEWADGETPGMTIVEAGNADGTLQKSGAFVINQDAVVVYDGIPGQISMAITLDGRVSPTGWSGTLTYQFFFQEYGITCRAQAPFIGDRVN